MPTDDLYQTHRVRYSHFLSLVNQFWKLEKEKLPLRKTLIDQVNSIANALRANLGEEQVFNQTVSPEYPALLKSQEETTRDIKVIQKKQNIILMDIKKIFVD